jgi:2-aminoadipate transaminase
MIAIKVDKKTDLPLYIQIREQIEDAITSKVLKPGDKLPSVTLLSKEIGVTQATVRRAMEDLSKKGYTKCHVGRGTFIEDLEQKPVKISQKPFDGRYYPHNVGHDSQGSEIKFAARRLRRGISEGLHELMKLAQQPGLIVFGKGIPDPGLHEKGLLKDLVKEALKEDDAKYMAYKDSLGLLELRQEIARTYRKKGIGITADHVLVTNGSQQAATLVAMDAADKRQAVLFETPCFQGITETFVAHGNWVETIARDEHGPMPDHMNEYNNHPFLLYLCPEFHNPIGTDLTPERHRFIVEWAKQNHATVLVDDIFQDLRFEGQRPESFFNTLGSNQTILISSISKSVMSGFRVGWLISSPAHIQRLGRFKRLVDSACPPLMQGLVTAMLKTGRYDSHIKEITKIYKKRRDVMVDCMEQLMPKGIRWTVPKGGFSLWVTLPDGYSSVALLLSAVDKGINFLPGPLFDVDQRYVTSFRLSWAWTHEDQIAEGIEILADTVKEMICHPPGESGLSGLGNFQ